MLGNRNELSLGRLRRRGVPIFVPVKHLAHRIDYGWEVLGLQDVPEPGREVCAELVGRGDAKCECGRQETEVKKDFEREGDWVWYFPGDLFPRELPHSS